MHGIEIQMSVSMTFQLKLTEDVSAVRERGRKRDNSLFGFVYGIEFWVWIRVWLMIDLGRPP